MTRPPEYDQVARWLRVLSGDRGLLEEIKDGYPGTGDVWTAGLTREEYAAEVWQHLADQAHRNLARVFPGGVSLESANLDQVAEAYHRQQVADYTHRKRALHEGIRQLRDGSFEVPAWCARRAERDGTDIAVVIEDYRQGALFDAQVEIGELPRQYQVTDDEARAYWAARLAEASFPGPVQPSPPGRGSGERPNGPPLAARRVPPGPGITAHRKGRGTC
jgi:hypothetical protein